MKKRVVVVGGRDELPGFRLAGVAGAVDVESPGALEKLMKEDGIILYTGKAKARLPQTQKGIIQEIPETAGYARIKEIIKNTIGFELR